MDFMKKGFVLVLISVLLVGLVVLVVNFYFVDVTYRQTVQPSTPDSGLVSANETENSTEEASNGDVENSIYKTGDEDFSYLAAILHVKNHLLGAGVVIGERWIITTAFQLGAFKPHQLQVRVGTPSTLEGGLLLPVKQLFVHPMFQQFNNDVALLKTADSVLSSPLVRLISIATFYPSLGDQGSLVMWNETKVQKNQADLLPVSECRVFYPDFELTDSNICVVMDRILPYQVTLYGSPVIFNSSLVGHYMGLEANTYKPSLCSNLTPLSGWIQLTMTNETGAQRIFPLNY